MTHAARSAARLTLMMVLSAALLAVAHLARAEEADVATSDRAAIRQVISDQMAAFQHDDARGAFRQAAPAIQDLFGTPDNFMAMVRHEYPVISRPRSFLFGELRVIAGELTQTVTVVDQDGNPFSAFYLMARQDDGSWRILGCVLVPLEHDTI